jgi:hypothetical protein
MIERTIDKRLSTPAVARQTARWAIRSVAQNPIGSYHALITAKVFTAFMFEGVINHLGERLCPTWNDPRPARASGKCRPSLSREPVDQKHKSVRQFLDLDNSGGQYQCIRPIVGRLFRFRDCFAHPKALQDSKEDRVESDLTPIPSIGWENDIVAPQVARDYEEIETYCISMLDTAAARLESTYQSGWDVAQEKYPHLANLKLEAACLKGFLHSSSNSDISVVGHATINRTSRTQSSLWTLRSNR